ncbi:MULTISPECIES: cell envelope integrity protein TolA [unclassified Marinobacterium]|uniref:cell envelope integrity protein TolA n=1 Tax=unclassified Marinobacterium TaxID=2644139 RepID=UPI0015699C3C|nr:MULTISPECIES: cell envelope integrity protein TolA [unclassified Marinobacterium]NRP16281.1 IgA-specific serine endopeptidase autotransporter precursor [Marinobacterium sp. xm-a-152]NRP36562.1 IgA-specific serine endopeptidase autotransporter precursor [Marinobacterium sp. xm-d-579]NRP39071.1 IgA-specific serine endopeptidase autotransporter precursor [Marinobacterium sp. xm-a-121]NRP60097.1 IgA-specific serine endopeptidase autotransporter precursor [Marinobacterium sp. xm-d-564]NRP96052.1
MFDRSYLLPTLFAALVHALVLVVISGVWIGQEVDRKAQPRHIEARMVDLSALAEKKAAEEKLMKDKAAAEAAKKKAAERAKKAKADEAKRKKAADAKRKADAKKAADKKKADDAKRKKAAEEKKRAEAERKAAERKKAEAAKKKADAEAKKAKLKAAEEAKKKAEAKKRQAEEAKRKAAEEAKRKADAERKAQEQAEAKRREELARQRAAAAERAAQTVADVGAYIRTLTEDNWRLPSTARNGMTATVRIHFFPSGEVDLAEIIKSSGDMAYDRSVLQAIERVGQYELIASVDPITFERNLRRVLIEFRPEGLRW